VSVLAVRDLEVKFGGFEAVKRISFEIPEQGTLALVGESGSGKSITALSIVGLLPGNATVGGEISFLGRRIKPSEVRGAQISMVFQEPMSSLNPVFSVGFQIGEVLREHRGLSRREARARTADLLEEVGLARERIDAYPFQLSGGQQQRVMIAMAIACEPKLLIADEPTSALDVTVQRQILELIAALQARRRMAMLFITHDLGLVGRVAERVAVMRAGEIREQGPVAEVLAAPRDSYTRMLLDSRPRGIREPAKGDTEVIVEARGLAKRFDDFEAVKGASFSLARGRTLGLVGESGSGKTTLGLLLARLQRASGGELRFHGRDAAALPPLEFKRRMQIVFQNPYASLNPRFSVGATLTEPLRIHAIGGGEAERREIAAGLLVKVGLTREALFKYPHEFSGGQRQRIAIARALALGPEVLICDEAVSALDVSIQAQLLNLLRSLQDEYSMSYLFISHDLAVVKAMADEVMVMKDGEIVEQGTTAELYANPKHPYTRRLLSAAA